MLLRILLSFVVFSVCVCVGGGGGRGVGFPVPPPDPLTCIFEHDCRTVLRSCYLFCFAILFCFVMVMFVL